MKLYMLIAAFAIAYVQAETVFTVYIVSRHGVGIYDGG